MRQVEGIIFDWAGTAVDFGCFAPVNVFVEIFKQAGVEVTLEEARIPMGMLKIDHIKAMLEMPRIGKVWETVYGKSFTQDDVNALYEKFEPMLLESLSQYTTPIDHVIDTVATLRERGLKIGSTTGYTDSMMAIVTEGAKAKGYAPEYWITPDTTASYGRPYPYMIFRNLEKLKISAPWKAIKVGDTTSDIKEGVAAGVWTVGVIIGSSELGMTKEAFEALSQEEREVQMTRVRATYESVGADFVIETMADLVGIVDEVNGLLAQDQRPYSSR
ncbi:MAG: phosphonoacetaldehyde hydrolase [Cellulosilyticaceae bacterium]